MNGTIEVYLRVLAIGAGATAVMDFWGIAQRRVLGIAAPNYGLVGRWLLYMTRGIFRHASIAATPRLRGEKAAGWTAHYGIGIVFAGLLVAIWGLDWVRQPTIGPALIVGLGTVALPLLVMQPGMGAGIASRRTPKPNSARLRSLGNHAVFGLGLFIAARLIALYFT
jgi:hypothetical protein